VPLPVTEHLTDTTLILPVFHQMSESEQHRVVDALRSAGQSA
jgi:dTDP-4-amino-4,6-dideoxygalactose transaminase